MEAIPELKPMRMTDESYDKAHVYLESDDWVLEQKLDGARTLVQVEKTADGARFKWYASGGGPLKFSAAVQHIEKIQEDLKEVLNATGTDYARLDGELIVEDGVFYIFDAPQVIQNGEIIIEEHMGYLERKNIIDYTYGNLLTVRESVKIVRTAIRHEAKMEMWNQILEANVEGGMAKHIDAIYQYGTRTTEMRKLKLVKTADVVVTYADRTFKADGKTVSHGKAALAVTIDPSRDPEPWMNANGKRFSEEAKNKLKGLRARGIEYRPRTLFPVGNASLIGKDLTIKEGDVVEVAYLYFQEAMIQPRITRKRLPEEKRPEDCTLDQFPEYSRKRV